jgi:cytochrome c-type biogenesis protein CcmH/NrfG
MSSPEASGPPTNGAPAPDDAEARRRRTVRFFAVIGTAAVVAVAAILVAVALNGPSGSGSSTSTPSGTSAPAATAKLPQLAIVLNRTDAISQMAASNQVVALQTEIASKPTASRYLDLGQAEMSLADPQAASNAFAHAAQLSPSTPEPLVGLAMIPAMSGTSAGLQAANAELQGLQSRFPNSQVVAFNLGWLALYRRDPATVKAAWARAIQLGKQTPLGIAATVLVAQIGKNTAK